MPDTGENLETMVLADSQEQVYRTSTASDTLCIRADWVTLTVKPSLKNPANSSPWQGRRFEQTPKQLIFGIRSLYQSYRLWKSYLKFRSKSGSTRYSFIYTPTRGKIKLWAPRRISLKALSGENRRRLTPMKTPNALPDH